MNLVLNTIGASVDNDMICSLIQENDIEVIDTSDMKIAHCVGCNQCWLKTPGVCAFKDDYEIILKKLIQAENLWLISDTRFGFLDYKGKRVMDRIMPMLNMTLDFRDGWMRHDLRYHALNIGLLYKGVAEKAMMEDWCKRTAANIGGHSLGAIPLEKTPETTVNSTLSTLNSKLTHLVILNGSPRVAKFSNTEKIIHSFAKGLEEAGVTWELHHLSNRNEWDAARKAYLDNERTIIAFPLYVECMPSLMLEFLATLPVVRQQPGELSFMLHGGMDEGNEFRLCERFLKTLPTQLGCSYGGTLIHGGSFRIRTAGDKEVARILDPYVKMGRIYAQKGNFLSPEATKFIGMEQYPWLVRKLVSLLALDKINGEFDQFAKSWGCIRPLDDKPYS